MKAIDCYDNNLKISQVWKKLTPFFEVDNLLEIGVGFSDCPKEIVDSSKHVERITIDKDILEKAKEQFQHSNVNCQLMGAEKLDYENEFFDCIFAKDAYHEIDASIREQALNEMYRVLKTGGTIIFIDAKESAVTNELFKVFDPQEDHAKRIKNSFDLLKKFVKDKKMDILMQGNSAVVTKFKSLDDYNETMLEWWSDVKIPKDEKEKNEMIKAIDNILTKAGMLDDLEIAEDARFIVMKK